jgi:hypothetical protein
MLFYYWKIYYSALEKQCRKWGNFWMGQVFVKIFLYFLPLTVQCAHWQKYDADENKIKFCTFFQVFGPIFRAHHIKMVDQNQSI